MAMRAVSVSGLKNNPAEALRQAKTDLVVVLNRDTPDALLVGLEKDGLLQAPGVRAALATALFRDGELSLARAARVAGIDLASFISHLSRLGIAAIRSGGKIVPIAQREELRPLSPAAVAHVIDMHQLTKDPSAHAAVSANTPSSPRRELNTHELARYLDYCSEMLSLAAKVAVLYVQSFPDPIVTEVVNDLERSAAALSQKIWLKIQVLEQKPPAASRL